MDHSLFCCLSPQVSVIVPIGPAESDLAPILAELARLPEQWQRLLVLCPEAAGLIEQADIAPQLLRQRIQVVESTRGRALQQNAGAQAASGEFLWFVHADSRLSEDAALQLEQNLQAHPEALHYFCLAFGGDGPQALGRNPMGLNARGANLRSRFGIPFGDQGFCLARSVFEQLGGFDENAAYGEDHLLVWRAHQLRVPLKQVDAVITTSARRYRDRGWWRLTLKYQWLWLKQAWPELCTLIRLRLGR